MVVDRMTSRVSDVDEAHRMGDVDKKLCQALESSAARCPQLSPPYQHLDFASSHQPLFIWAGRGYRAGSLARAGELHRMPGSTGIVCCARLISANRTEAMACY